MYVPFCPHCGELAYEEDKCVFCDKPYNRVEGDVRPVKVSKGDYTVIQSTNNHISLYKNGKLIMHAQHNQKKTEKELLEEIDSYETLFACAEG